jgi:hypothetical protein
MRLRVIACDVFCREVCAQIVTSPHTIDVEFLPKGLHDLGAEPMLARLQDVVDRPRPVRYDAVVLVYGLCNNGLSGLSARSTRIVLPRAHDCIAVFLGSRDRYREQFHAHPGTYYRTPGWLEHADTEVEGATSISEKLGLFLQYEELVAKYGEDNAKYIMETMGDGLANYDRLAYIRMGLPDENRFREQAVREAAEKKLHFEEIDGSMDWLRRLLHGDWSRDVLVLEPGETIRPSHDDDVVKAAPAVTSP